MDDNRTIEAVTEQREFDFQQQGSTIPNDLEPRSVTVGVNDEIDRSADIYVVIDADQKTADQITTFNNVAHRELTGEIISHKAAAKPFPRGRRHGR
jgi:hypothetical protein